MQVGHDDDLASPQPPQGGRKQQIVGHGPRRQHLCAEPMAAISQPDLALDVAEPQQGSIAPVAVTHLARVCGPPSGSSPFDRQSR